MIAYTYLKSNNKIISRVKNVTQVTGDSVTGIYGATKGIDTSLVGIILLDTDIELTKTVGAEAVPLGSGDIIDIAPLTDVKRRFEIFNRLEELDKVISRDTEQLYVDASLTPSYSTMADAITEKVALRLELTAL